MTGLERATSATKSGSRTKTCFQPMRPTSGLALLSETQKAPTTAQHADSVTESGVLQRRISFTKLQAKFCTSLPVCSFGDVELPLLICRSNVRGCALKAVHGSGRGLQPARFCRGAASRNSELHFARESFFVTEMITVTAKRRSLG